jgi:hypothetical protein
LIVLTDFNLLEEVFMTGSAVFCLVTLGNSLAFIYYAFKLYQLALGQESRTKISFVSKHHDHTTSLLMRVVRGGSAVAFLLLVSSVNWIFTMIQVITSSNDYRISTYVMICTEICIIGILLWVYRPHTNVPDVHLYLCQRLTMCLCSPEKGTNGSFEIQAVAEDPKWNKLPQVDDSYSSMDSIPQKNRY